MAGTTLGFLKFVLGFDSIAFKKGMTDAEKELLDFQKKTAKIGKGFAAVGVAASAAFSVPFAKMAADGIREARETEEAMARVSNALRQAGSVAGQTAPQLAEAAAALETKSLYEADQVLSDVTATMLRFGGIVPQNFAAAQQAAVDFAAATGAPLEQASTAIGKALTSPTKGLKALQAVGVTFTKAQTKQLQTWIDTGNAAKAQGVILNALKAHIQGAAEAAQNADPWNKLSDAYKGIAETIGTALIPYVKAFTDALSSTLTFLNSFGPGVTQAAVGFGVLLAVIGPVTTAIGSFMVLISGSKKVMQFAKDLELLAKAESLAAAGAALMNLGLLPLVGIMAAVAVAVTALVVAWDNWDAIVAVVKSVYDAVKTWIVDGLTTVWNWLKSSLASVVEWFRGLLRAVPFIAAIYNAAKGWVVDKLGAVWNWLKGALDTVVGWFWSMVAKIKEFLGPVAEVIGGAFSRAWAAIKGGVASVGPAVKGVADDMKGKFASVDLGLDEAVDKTGKKAKAKGKEKGDELKKDMESLFKTLFPERAAWDEYQAQLKMIAEHWDMVAAAGYTAADAQRAAMDAFAKAQFGENKIEVLDDPQATTPIVPDIKVTIDEIEKANDDSLEKIGDLTGKKTMEMAQAWKDMADSAITSMKGMVEAFKSGDILGGIQHLLDLVLKLVTTLARMGTFGSGPQGVAGGPMGGATAFAGGARQGFGGARALGGPVVPGKTYMVGENGPEWFSSKRRGFIHPTGKEAEPQRVVVVPSPYFDVVVDKRAANVAAPMAGQAAVYGVVGSEVRANRRARRNLLAA